MKKFIVTISIVAILVMALATGLRFGLSMYDPYTELPPEIWNNGNITRLLSFQHPSTMLSSSVPYDDPGPAVFGLGMVIVTIILIVQANKKYSPNRKFYVIGLILITATRLAYWIPYMIFS